MLIRPDTCVEKLILITHLKEDVFNQKQDLRKVVSRITYARRKGFDLLLDVPSLLVYIRACLPEQSINLNCILASGWKWEAKGGRPTWTATWQLPIGQPVGTGWLCRGLPRTACALNQQAAIKVLHAHLTEQEAEHFQQEAADHCHTRCLPGIVRVFDY